MTLVVGNISDFAPAAVVLSHVIIITAESAYRKAEAADRLRRRPRLAADVEMRRTRPFASRTRKGSRRDPGQGRWKQETGESVSSRKVGRGPVARPSGRRFLAQGRISNYCSLRGGLRGQRFFSSLVFAII